MDASNIYDELYTNDVVRVGEFTLKSGHKSPIYIDFRHVQSQPKINRIVVTALVAKLQQLRTHFDFVCGVPIGAAHYASVCGWVDNIGVLTYRKDVKTHGTRRVVEGTFTKGDRVMLIEDVVTTGSSVLQTALAMRAEGLCIEHAIVLLDRGQGASALLQSHGITLHALWSMEELLQYSVVAGKLTDVQASDVRQQLMSMMAPRDGDSVQATPPANKCWSLRSRMQLTDIHKQTVRLMQIMAMKQTNLCAALDFDNHDDIYMTAKHIAPRVCAIKVHADIIAQFSVAKMMELRALADEKSFILIEDRKLSDTATTVYAQLMGVTHIVEWAHMITVHTTPGDSVFNGAKMVESIRNGNVGLIVVAELSTKDALTNIEGYKKSSVTLAQAHCDTVCGFVSQTRCADDPKFLYFTPGVHMSSSGDGKGQQFRSPATAIGTQLNDIVIAGRAITDHKNDPNAMIAAAEQLAKESWMAFESRADMN